MRRRACEKVISTSLGGSPGPPLPLYPALYRRPRIIQTIAAAAAGGRARPGRCIISSRASSLSVAVRRATAVAGLLPLTGKFTAIQIGSRPHGSRPVRIGERAIRSI